MDKGLEQTPVIYISNQKEYEDAQYHYFFLGKCKSKQQGAIGLKKQNYVFEKDIEKCNIENGEDVK